MEGAQWFSLCISFFKKKNKTYFPGALGRSSSQIIAQSSVTLSELVVFIPSNWANQRKDGCGGTLTVSGHTFIRSLSCPALNIFMAPHCLAKKARAFLVSYWNSSSMRGSTSLGLTPTGLLSLNWCQAILPAMSYMALYFPALLFLGFIVCNMFVSSPFPTTPAYILHCSSLHVNMQTFIKDTHQMFSLLLKPCLILQSRKTFPSFTFLMLFYVISVFRY